MSLSSAALKYRPITVTLVFLLILWGVASVMTMPRREDPEYTVRTCAVVTSWPGAPAEKVEELITDKLEEAIDSIEEVDVVRSTTTSGLSEIYVDAEDYITPERIDNVWDKVRARVGRVKLPEPGLTPVVNDEFGDVSILLLGIHQQPLPGEDAVRDENRYTYRQLEMIAEDVQDAIRLLDGVSKVELHGVIDEAIYVETDNRTWSQLGLTIGELQQLLEQRNIVAPGGVIEADAGRFFIKPGGEFNAVEELNRVMIDLGTESGERRPITLADAGLEVRRDYADPPKRICRAGTGTELMPAVIVGVQMKSGSNIIDVCDAAKQRVEEMRTLEQSLPSDITVEIISDQSENVDAKISQVVGNVIGAIVIVVIIVYLMVGFRTAAVMAANIPVVVLAAVALITLFGVQLEQISLASIIIALGLLVDNAVQVCDQSRTNQINGMAPREATTTGANQLSMAMLSGTATTIAAFFPMLIALQGSRQEYVYSLPVTLTVTLAISWVLAMSFCVVLAAAFIRAPRDPSKPSAPVPWLVSLPGRLRKSPPTPGEKGLVERLFRLLVMTALRLKFPVVVGAFGLLFFVLRLPVASEFFPKDLRDQFAIQIWLPETSTIEQTDRAAQQVETILERLNPVADPGEGPDEKIRSMRTMVGGGGTRWYLSWDPEGTTSNYAELLVRTTDARFTPELAGRVREIAEFGDEELGLAPVAGARVIPRELYLGPSSDPVALRVTGTGFAEMTTLRTVAEQVRALIVKQPGTWDVNDSWGIPGFQLRVDVDEDKANLAGVTNAKVAQSLNTFFSGQQLTTFREGDHLVPVYLRLTERDEIDAVRSVFVEGAFGKVPLESIATFTPTWVPARIERRDRNRVIEVRSQVEAGYQGNDVVKTILASEEMAALESQLPAGFWIEVGGSLEDSQDGTEELSLSLAVSLMTIVLILVIQYNGWSKPIVILATLPLALLGAIPGLYFTGNALGFMPQLGILSLFGIVLNTGIIFIEFADLLILQKAEEMQGDGPICGLTKQQFRECLADAGWSRLLPIFLTTSTTIGGLLPLAVGGGPLWEGMSWAMIYGLVVATVLTLVVVPALYAILVETFGVKPVGLSVGAPAAGDAANSADPSAAS